MCGHDVFQFFGPDATRISASFFFLHFVFILGRYSIIEIIKRYCWIVSAISTAPVTAVHLCVQFDGSARA